MATKKSATTAQAVDQTDSTALVQLPPEERAAAVLQFDATIAKLRTLAGASTSLTRVDTDDNFAAAKAAREKLRSTRTSIEKTGKAARDDATKFGKAVIAKERQLIAVITPEEGRLAQLIEAEQQRRDEAERAAREAEQRRAEQIRAAFERVRALPAIAETHALEQIGELIAEAERLRDDPSHLPEDLHAAARYEANVAAAAVKAVRDRRLQAQRDAAELEQLRREKAEREERERRAEANREEVQRAAGVVQANAKPVDDDDLPPPTSAPRPDASLRDVAAAIPAVVTVPVQKVLPLLVAARAALALLRARGLGGEPAALELSDAIDEADEVQR